MKNCCKLEGYVIGQISGISREGIRLRAGVD